MALLNQSGDSHDWEDHDKNTLRYGLRRRAFAQSGDPVHVFTASFIVPQQRALFSTLDAFRCFLDDAETDRFAFNSLQIGTAPNDPAIPQVYITVRAKDIVLDSVKVWIQCRFVYPRS
jgi:hypothetical protein